MVEHMPSIVEDKIPEKAPIDFEKAEVGKKYLMKLEHPDTGEMVEKGVEVTVKRENETIDGSPGTKILVYQYEGF